MRPSEVESPMCTTARQLVRAGPADRTTAARRGGWLAAEVLVAGAAEVRAAGAGADGGWDAAAGLAGPGCTTPAMPQLASTTRAAEAGTTILACRPRAP